MVTPVSRPGASLCGHSAIIPNSETHVKHKIVFTIETGAYLMHSIKTLGNLTLWTHVGQQDVRQAMAAGMTAAAYCGTTWYFIVADKDGREVWSGPAVSEEEALATAWVSIGGRRYA